MFHVDIIINSVPLITCVTRNSVTVTKHSHEAGDQVSVSQSHRPQDAVGKTHDDVTYHVSERT